MSAYRVLTNDEVESLNYDPYYEVLIGPDGFECVLGEPEDRYWRRDGKDAVKRLNEQHEELERLRDLLSRISATVAGLQLLLHLGLEDGPQKD